MRQIIIALLFCLLFAFISTAHADTFKYTIVWEYSHVASTDTSAFMGTYTFTVNSLLIGDTVVSGPGFCGGVNYASYPSVCTTDFAAPENSKVSQVLIGYYPGINSLYGFTLLQANTGRAVATSLIQDSRDPNKFSGGFSDGSGDFVSMEITELSDASPVPEPASITLLGLGAIAVGSRVRQFRKRV